MQPDVKQKFKEAAKQVSDHVKEQIYEASHYNMSQNLKWEGKPRKSFDKIMYYL